MPPPQPPQQPPTTQSPSAFLSTVLNPNAPTPSTSSSTSTPPRPARTSASIYDPPSRTTAPTSFSTTQRSLQARNKEYNVLGRNREESYETRQRREEAGRILESTEMVIWWSGARGESIPQTRHYFTNILLGIEDDDEHVAWREEWEVGADKGMVSGAVGSSPRSAKGKEREKERGKRRVSSGAGA